MKNTKGLMIATAAATLFTSVELSAADESKAAEAKVHCGGVNACKGTSECKTSTNACKGQNSCAGQGFVSMSIKQCKAKGGHVVK